MRDHLVASFLKRVSTSCSITRACSGPTRVGNTLLNRGGRDPNWILYPLSTVCRTHWDTFGRSFHAARKSTKGTSLPRLASGVLWTTSSVPWSGGPAGNSRSSCSKHFLEVVSFSGPLHFQAEAEKETRWRSLCPKAPRLAEEKERSPEGTEERRAPYTEVCTTLPQRGLPSRSPKP